MPWRKTAPQFDYDRYFVATRPTISPPSDRLMTRGVHEVFGNPSAQVWKSIMAHHQNLPAAVFPTPSVGAPTMIAAT
jgi:hypothetical protein